MQLHRGSKRETYLQKPSYKAIAFLCQASYHLPNLYCIKSNLLILLQTVSYLWGTTPSYLWYVWLNSHFVREHILHCSTPNHFYPCVLSHSSYHRLRMHPSQSKEDLHRHHTLKISASRGHLKNPTNSTGIYVELLEWEIRTSIVTLPFRI